MQLNVAVLGLERVKKQMSALSGQQLREAGASALNDTAFQLRRDMQQHMRTRFDRVTPWIERSPRVIPATAEKLQASVMPTYRSDAGTTGGKAGVDPQQVLQAQEFGGRRADKRSEVALRRAGILPRGMQTAIPSTPYRNSDDGRGNLRGPFLRQVLSYLQAFNLAGSGGNMSARRKKAIHDRGGKGSRFVGPVRGVRYIVAYGSQRGGSRMTASGEHDGRMGNLPAGIWAVQGTGGVDVRPVLLFVRQGTYRPRLDLQQLSNDAARTEYLGRRLRYRIRNAFEGNA